MVTLFVVVVALAVGKVAWSNCPECYGDQHPMDGHGAAPDGSGRRLITVRIDPSWGTPTNPSVWDAVNAAIAEWNNARDAFGNSTGYYLELNQNLQNPDIKIVQGDPGNGCAGTTVQGPPYTTTLPSGFVGFSRDEQRGRIGHEISHPFGLSENLDPNCLTIASGSDQQCHRTNNHVLSNDVAAVNRNFGPGRTENCNSASGNVHLDSTPTPISSGCDPSARQECYYTWSWSWDEQSCTCFCDSTYGCFTPVLVDVRGDGFAMTDAEHGVNFDMAGSGVPEKMSWTAAGSDDAWLFLDQNGDGIVNNGLELFGNATPQLAPPAGINKNGFNALAEYDEPANGGNADGVISNQDVVFSTLKLWQDSNHDGVSEPSEIHKLADFGLKTLGLHYKQSKRTDEFGNRFRYRAKVTDTHDAQMGRSAWDVFLVTPH
jgi:hypothetical protein